MPQRCIYAYKAGSLYQPTYLGKRDDVDPDHADSLKFKSEGRMRTCLKGMKAPEDIVIKEI